MASGAFTVFYRGDRSGSFRRGEPEEIECPDGMSELVLRLSAGNVQALSGAAHIGTELDAFFSRLWTERVVGKTGIAAARFSYAGYAYWVAMSTRFFEYAKTEGIVEPPPDFPYGSGSGCIFRETGRS